MHFGVEHKMCECMHYVYEKRAQSFFTLILTYVHHLLDWMIGHIGNITIY